MNQKSSNGGVQNNPFESKNEAFEEAEPQNNHSTQRSKLHAAHHAHAKKSNNPTQNQSHTLQSKIKKHVHAKSHQKTHESSAHHLPKNFEVLQSNPQQNLEANKSKKSQLKTSSNYTFVERIWDISLAAGLVGCFIMIGFLSLQNQENKQFLQTAELANQANFQVPNLVKKSTDSVVQIQRKTTAAQMAELQKKAADRTIDSGLKLLLQNAAPADTWEPIGWGVLTSESDIVSAKQLTVFNGEFRAEFADGSTAKIAATKRHPHEDLALFSTENPVNFPSVRFASSSNLGQKIWAFSGTHFITDGFSSGNIHSVSSNYNALMNDSILLSNQPKPLIQALQKSTATDQFKQVFNLQSFSSGRQFLHTAPIMVGGVGLPIFNANGELLGLQSVSISEPDSSVFVARDSVNFNSDLAANSSLSDVSLTGVKPGSGFVFQVAISAPAIKQFAENSTINLAYFPINGFDLNPVLMGMYGISDFRFGFFVQQTLTDKPYPIKPGDVIISIGDFAINSTTSFGEALHNYENSDSVLVTFLRKNTDGKFEQQQSLLSIEKRGWETLKTE